MAENPADYNQDGLNSGVNPGRQGPSTMTWSYKNTNATIAYMLSDGYFNDAVRLLKTDHMMSVVGSDGNEGTETAIFHVKSSVFDTSTQTGTVVVDNDLDVNAQFDTADGYKNIYKDEDWDLDDNGDILLKNGITYLIYLTSPYTDLADKHFVFPADYSLGGGLKYMGTENQLEFQVAYVLSGDPVFDTSAITSGPPSFFIEGIKFIQKEAAPGSGYNALNFFTYIGGGSITPDWEVITFKNCSIIDFEVPFYVEYVFNINFDKVSITNPNNDNTNEGFAAFDFKRIIIEDSVLTTNASLKPVFNIRKQEDGIDAVSCNLRNVEMYLPLSSSAGAVEIQNAPGEAAEDMFSSYCDFDGVRVMNVANGEVVQYAYNAVIKHIITNLTSNGTNWVATTREAHGLVATDKVSLYNVGGYDSSNLTIASVTSTTFTIANTTNISNIKDGICYSTGTTADTTLIPEAVPNWQVRNSMGIENTYPHLSAHTFGEYEIQNLAAGSWTDFPVPSGGYGYQDGSIPKDFKINSDTVVSFEYTGKTAIYASINFAAMVIGASGTSSHRIYTRFVVKNTRGELDWSEIIEEKNNNDQNSAVLRQLYLNPGDVITGQLQSQSGTLTFSFRDWTVSIVAL